MRTLLAIYLASVIFSFGAINANMEGQGYGREIAAPEGLFFAVIPGANMLIAISLNGEIGNYWRSDAERRD